MSDKYFAPYNYRSIYRIEGEAGLREWVEKTKRSLNKNYFYSCPPSVIPLPLFQAIDPRISKEESLAVAKALLEGGANPLLIDKKYETTPYDYAVEKGAKEIVELYDEMCKSHPEWERKAAEFIH